MNAAIYSPYLDTAGGGEKYMLTIAALLSKTENVHLLLDSHLATLDVKKILTQIELFHNLDLSKIILMKAPIGKNSSVFDRYFFLKKYDLLICNTDGSIFHSSAKRSIIHFQVPFENTSSKGFWGSVKLASWEKAIYNSLFTKEIIEKTWNIKGEVIYPPVSVELFKPSKKVKQILTVGRFFSVDKSKKHQLMIDVFKELCVNDKLWGWSFAIAGSCMEGDEGYVEELKKKAGGADITFHVNASLSELQKLYGESYIYWHAKGYGETNPRDFEHFGISTVEAMSAGCVPVVINLGGQKEIVENQVTGFLWNTVQELKDLTLKVVNDEDAAEKMSQSAQSRAQDFSKDKFEAKILELVQINES